jgi:hypothetical protein
MSLSFRSLRSPTAALVGLLALSTLVSCDDPLPLPTEAAASEQHDRSLDPPLYRTLYDYAFLPETQYKEQRVRLLIWLEEMEFNRLQLGLLAELAGQVARERDAITAKQMEIVAKYEPTVAATYDKIWEGMQARATAAQLDALAPDLQAVHDREHELLALRAQSVRALFEAQAPFLQTLSPAQEIRFTDATFLLRHRLDPYANPGDFNALIGPVYVAGQFGALSKATFDPNEDHLNIGGLWSPNPERLTGPQYPNARREVLLYMVLLEPALKEALDAETALRPVSEPSSASPGAVPGTPTLEPAPPGTPGGTPVVPGGPTPPTPGVPGATPAPGAAPPVGVRPAVPPKPGIPEQPKPGNPGVPPPPSGP